MKCCATLQGLLHVPGMLGIALPVIWVIINAPYLYGTQHGMIRVILTSIFALLILCRPQRSAPPASAPIAPGHKRLVLMGILGAVAVVIGIMAPVHQLEWIGLLLVTYACLDFTLPRPIARNLPAAIFVFYWINPLPSALFGLLQSSMQRASVLGAEWFLHLLNTRVWADGLILRTGTQLFEVPAWCSGMRTATTVFILSLAVGILRRLRLFELTAFIGWSLLHALALNILRISAMIYFAPHLTNTADLEFLHDTAGLIVLAGVLLVYIELLVIEHIRRQRQRRRESLKAARDGALSEYPPFWHRFFRRRGAVSLSLALLVAIGLIGWRSRPYHRTMMLRDVVLSLRDHGDTSNATRLAAIVSTRLPKTDLDWRFTAIRLDLIAGNPQRALDELETIDDLPTGMELQRRILQAYGFLLLGNLEAASDIVAQLPADKRRGDPRVAMILAEMALRRKDADAVAEHVVTAGQWSPNAGRIRRLYPFLRQHRKWDAMAATDIDVPYMDPVQALSILEAFMFLNNVPRVAQISLEMLERHPDNPSLLEPLFFMALLRGSDWENRFQKHLTRILPSVKKPETLYEMFYKCFELSRPDLGWQIYRRLADMDADHPVLDLCAVEYGARWFVFRRHYLGLPATGARDTIDLKPFVILGRLLPQWRPLLQTIPQSRTLSAADTVPARKKLLQRAISGFSSRDREDGLSAGLRILYAKALERAGRLDLARQQLDNLEREYPEEVPFARELLSEMYERKGAWIQVYETLRTYLLESPDHQDADSHHAALAAYTQWPPRPLTIRQDTENIHLPAILRLGEAQTRLHFPLAARFTAHEAVRLYPHAPRAKVLLAKSQLRIGRAEEALQRLANARVRNLQELDELEAEALMKTERYTRIQTFRRSRLLPPVGIPSDTIQNTSLPPAELSLLWHRTQIPAEAEFVATAEALQKNLPMAGEGLRPLFSRWLESWATPGFTVDMERWAATGRDRLEQATALNQLTLLLCRESRFAEALPVARAAVAALPASPSLWHILISLSGGDTDIIRLAREHCPRDAEIWLADLVMRTRPEHSIPQTDAEWNRVRDAIKPLVQEADQHHIAARTRAAEYCWRGGLRDVAATLSTHLAENARGLLPACIATIRGALHQGNTNRALASTEAAINASVNPIPTLHENLVMLKTADGIIDTDSQMLNSLRELRKADADNPLWPQLLGYVRFQRGGWEIIDAMFEMNKAIAGGATNRTPFLISAEVSRLLRQYDRAADTLRRGLKHHPGHPALLNNLAFVLAQTPETVPAAIDMLPTLEAAAAANPAILDTLSVVYLRAGELETARQTIARLLKRTEPGSPLWFRAQTHLAEIAWKRGQVQTAISMLEQLLKGSRNIPDEDILMANALFNQITGERIPIE